MRTLPSSGPSDAIERDILEQITAANVRLRHDKSVVRLREDVTARVSAHLASHDTLLFTVTAPIRRRARTAEAIAALVPSGRPGQEVDTVIEGNQVRLRVVTGVPPSMPRVIGFVLNPEVDAALILAIAESRLIGFDGRRDGETDG